MQPKHRPLWIAAIALVVLPLALRAIGLTLDNATVVVILALTAMGLNVLVGHTGLVSFGHSAWFGIGGYAAALIQLHWLQGQFVLPLLLSMAFTAALSCAVGYLILRRRGVYFSLLTLALCALTFAIAFRWTALTGGEGGLGGIERGTLGPLDLNDHLTYYVLVALIAFAVVWALLRVSRSPFGHLQVAIRENEQRASFQGHDTQRCKLGAFVLSATVTGLAGALLVFLHRLAAAESTTVAFSGEMLAMVVIGGMRSFLGPALGALFYLLFRELFSIYTNNWLLWFGLVFVGFVIFSPTGLVGIWGQLQRRWRPPPEEGAAMSKRARARGAAAAGVPARQRRARRPAGARGARSAQALRRHPGGERRAPHAAMGPRARADRPQRRRQDDPVQPDLGAVPADARQRAAARPGRSKGLPPQRTCQLGLARSFQITNLFKGLTIHENLRLSLQARHAGRFNAWRDTDRQATVLARDRLS